MEKKVQNDIQCEHQPSKECGLLTFQQATAALLCLALDFIDVLMTIRPRSVVLPKGTE